KEINTNDSQSSLMRVSNSNKQKLDPWHITGFSDAEGCFIINIRERKKNKIHWGINGIFKICVHIKDLPILKEIQQYFGGIGSISIVSTRNEVNFSVQDIKSITDVIIPHFDKYPLESAKKIDYK